MKSVADANPRAEVTVKTRLWPVTFKTPFHAQKLARPEGLERTLPTIEIEGVPELVEFLRAA